MLLAICCRNASLLLFLFLQLWSGGSHCIRWCSNWAIKDEIQTHKRFKRTPFIRTKHKVQIFGVIPFVKLQSDKQQFNFNCCLSFCSFNLMREKQWKMRWGATPLICFGLSYVVYVCFVLCGWILFQNASSLCHFRVLGGKRLNLFYPLWWPFSLPSSAGRDALHSCNDQGLMTRSRPMNWLVNQLSASVTLPTFCKLLVAEALYLHWEDLKQTKLRERKKRESFFCCFLRTDQTK